MREAVLPEVTGIVVPIRSPRALAQGVLRLHANPGEAERFAAEGKKRVLEHFTPEVLTERTLDVYDRVLSGRVGPGHPVGYLAG